MTTFAEADYCCIYSCASSQKNTHTRDTWEKNNTHTYTHTKANETLHFMLHETENGIWEEVDSASSQRTRGKLSIPL